MAEPSEAFVCDLTVMTHEQRDRLIANARELFAAAGEVRDLADGYALGYANAPAELLSRMAEFIAFDRLCCPFVRHALVVEPHGATTWLELTGGVGVKDAIRADVLRLLPQGIAT
jgi:hypothetical protein